MKLWKGNRLDGEVEAAPAELAQQFVTWLRQPEQAIRRSSGIRLERSLRFWLSSPDGFNATWEDESDAGFGAIFDAAYDLIYGTVRAGA